MRNRLSVGIRPGNAYMQESISETMEKRNKILVGRYRYYGAY